MPYLDGNPFEVIRNSDGSYTFDTNSINPDYYMYHVDCLQKGMYMAGHLWTEMNSKYNCAVITYTESGATGFVDLRKSFNSWLRANSKYGAEMKDSWTFKPFSLALTTPSATWFPKAQLPTQLPMISLC